jgi:hypothetical protein
VVRKPEKNKVGGEIAASRIRKFSLQIGSPIFTTFGCEETIILFSLFTRQTKKKIIT